MKLGNLASRVATAAALVPLLILVINWERPIGIWLLVFAATLLAAHEYFAMALDDRVERAFGLGLAATLAAVVYWVPDALAVALPAVVVAPALFYLFRFGEMSTVVARMGATTFGLVYAGLLLTFVAFLKRDFGAHGADWVYVVLMTAWFGDTGAYFAGRFLGRTKLYPAVSPGKTRAGAVGGLVGSFLAAVLANLWFFRELGWGHGAVVTLIGGALGQTGDLVESLMKRARGVKDSGKLLPGHGGMLDRIDAVLFIAPWVYSYATVFWSP